MGKLVDGKWQTGSIVSSTTGGAYDRPPRTFLDTIDKNHSVFKPESGRYHLYVSYACPWAHRTLIYRQLKGLENHISVNVVHPDMLEMGWSFDTGFDGSTGDEWAHAQYLYQVYQRAMSDLSSSVTVPVLWDKHTERIVNNESSEIIRIFNTAFNTLTENFDDYYPKTLRPRIDEINAKIYHSINNGVYRTGFARTQTAYDKAVTNLFTTLDELDRHLESNQFLAGDQLTEADIRLIPTLLRFDVVYYVHFKCNVRKISDYPNLSKYTRDLYALPAVRDTTHFDHIKRHYYYSHEGINPHRIVPAGPEDFIGADNNQKVNSAIHTGGVS